MMTLLSSDELAQMTLTIDFADAARTSVQTADIKPIDSACSAALSAWALAQTEAPQGFPTHPFRGQLVRGLVSERLRPLIEPSKHAGWSEPAWFDVQGARDGDWTILFITKVAEASLDGKTKIFHPIIRGIQSGSPKLLHSRSLPIEVVENLTDSAPSLFSRFEAKALEQGLGLGVRTRPRIL